MVFVINNKFFRNSQSRYLFGLTFLFVGLAFLQLGLANNNLRPVAFVPLLVLMLCSGTTIFLLHRRFSTIDPILLPITFFLSGFGLVLTSRLAPAFISRQLLWLGVATAALLLVNLVPKNLNWLYRYKYTWLISGLILLAATLVLGVNPSGFGARLWLQVGNFFIQPSEPLKLLLVVFLAGYIASRRRQLIEERIHIGRFSIPHLTYYGPMLLMWGFSIILLVWQRDLGAALLFFGTFLGMLYAATGKGKYVWAGGLLFAVAAAIGYFMFDVVRLRVDGFLNPWLDPSGRSFQIVQSLLAFANGGLFGDGLGQGLPTAIPVVHTDFVYAAIGEEYGLLGALAILLCFMLLIGRAFHIAMQAKSEFEQLLAAGIGTMLGLQTIIITAGTLKLLPLTGVTLPLVSYGGSSLVTSFLMVGLLLFISARPQTVPDAMPATPHKIYHLPLARAIFAGLLVVAGGLILWQVLLAPFLLSRSDNPRRVIAEQKVDRGRLLTRGDIPIAETIIDEDGLAQRHYPYPELSSVTGYHSIRYGQSGTEAVFNPVLRGALGETPEGEFWADLLHRAPTGSDVTLTIDLPAQVAADIALGNQEGAVVVLDIETGAVLAMSSHPTYDPNTLDEQWDVLRIDERAPLLNRTTQGLFPLGDLARLVGLIGVLDSGATIPADPLAAPLDDLVAPLGPTGYLATAHQLGFGRPVPGVRSLPGLLPQFPPEGKGTVRDLAVTPLHLARVIAGIEMNGNLPTPILAIDGELEQNAAMSPVTAQTVRALLPQVDSQMIGLTGQATPEETGKTSLSWFVGLAPATASPLPEKPPSPALTENGLIFDPTKIDTTQDTETVSAPPVKKARYAVVVVVVTDTPEDNPALNIAIAPIVSLLER